MDEKDIRYVYRVDFDNSLVFSRGDIDYEEGADVVIAKGEEEAEEVFRTQNWHYRMAPEDMIVTYSIVGVSMETWRKRCGQ